MTTQAPSTPKKGRESSEQKEQVARKRQRSWVEALPEIVGGLMRLLNEKGQDHDDWFEAPWEAPGKGLNTAGLNIMSEGNEESGPYRLSIYLLLPYHRR